MIASFEYGSITTDHIEMLATVSIAQAKSLEFDFFSERSPIRETYGIRRIYDKSCMGKGSDHPISIQNCASTTHQHESIRPQDYKNYHDRCKTIVH